MTIGYLVVGLQTHHQSLTLLLLQNYRLQGFSGAIIPLDVFYCFKYTTHPLNGWFLMPYIVIFSHRMSWKRTAQLMIVISQAEAGYRKSIAAIPKPKPYTLSGATRNSFLQKQPQTHTLHISYKHHTLFLLILFTLSMLSITNCLRLFKPIESGCRTFIYHTRFYAGDGERKRVGNG